MGRVPLTKGWSKVRSMSSAVGCGDESAHKLTLEVPKVACQACQKEPELGQGDYDHDLFKD